MWTFPTTSVNQCWEPITLGMAPWQIREDVDKQTSKEALQSPSPLAAFKACNMIHALGIAYSKIVLPSGDSKSGSKGRTHCPTTWSQCYQWEYASQYADQLRNVGASPLLCKECTLLVRIQLSKKNANHPNCAFADCKSTTMCGAMISLTPCIAPKIPRECDLQEVVQFQDANDMIQQLNGILAKPVGFPQIPDPRKDCHLFQANPGERHQQYVLCPEQDCEWLVYMSDQNTSMIEALDVQEHPLWKQRMQDYHDWQQKINKGSKTSKESWTWQEGTSSKWPTSSRRGSSKRGQSVPVDILDSKRTNQEEKGLPWNDLGELNVDKDYLYPSDTVIPCPVEKEDQLSPEQQVTYIQWIVYCFNLDHKVDKDPRIYCSYCDVNNHLRFSRKHVNKHRKPMERHHCTRCAAEHPPFLCPRAQVTGGPAQPNWYKTEYKRAKQENREADYRWGPMVTHDDVDGLDSTSQHQMEAPQPVCAAAAMMHGMPMAPASSAHGGCPSIAEHQEFAPCMPPPEMTMMQREVITPNPGYKIPDNLWDLNIAHCAHAPSPLATFICHCSTMESPYYPIYSKQGVSVPADSMSDLNHGTSSIEQV